MARVLLLLTCTLTIFTPSASGFAWSECGHHVIAVLAFELLSEDEQNLLLSTLAAHPRFAEDFSPDDVILRGDRWRVGTAGYWPDIARQMPEYDRPTWHYQLGATLVMGDTGSVNVPPEPGPLPAVATLETRELHIAQAVELCRCVLSDLGQTAGDRAIAITWLGHLVADAHQPCHAGSLYVADVLPNGDRGANEIPVELRRNLHIVWDDLLGRNFEECEVNRRVQELCRDRELMMRARQAAAMRDSLNPLTWLHESREAALQYVYTPEVLDAVTAASRGFVPGIQPIRLSEDYIRRAEALARVRACLAAQRLACLWRAALKCSAQSRVRRPH